MNKNLRERYDKHIGKNKPLNLLPNNGVWTVPVSSTMFKVIITAYISGSTTADLIYQIRGVGVNNMDSTLRNVLARFIELPITTKEELLEDLQVAQNELDVINMKLQFLDETKGSEYDEDEFLAYSSVIVLDNKKMTTVEKAREIVKLLKTTK